MQTIGIGTLARRAPALSLRRDVASVKRSAMAKLADVQSRIAELEKVRDGLSRLIRSCPGHGRSADCPILRALSEEEA